MTGAYIRTHFMGATVTILTSESSSTATNIIFTGEVVDASDETDILRLKLTAATGPYVIGQTITLDVTEIISIA